MAFNFFNKTFMSRKEILSNMVRNAKKIDTYGKNYLFMNLHPEK